MDTESEFKKATVLPEISGSKELDNNGNEK